MRFTAVFTLFLAGQALAAAVANPDDTTGIEARDDNIEAREILDDRANNRAACNSKSSGDRCTYDCASKSGTCYGHCKSYRHYFLRCV